MDNIEENLSAYFSGFLTKEENILVEQWSEVNADNRKLFIETKKIFDITPVDDSNFVPDINEAWDTVSTKIEKKSKSFNISLNTLYKIAAVVLVTVGLGYFSLLQFNEPKIIAVKTNNSQTKEMLLPDGTRVILNNNSTLRYPEFFKENERKISLEGQAFFDVERDEKAIFVIKTNNSVVSVLGTAFDVIAANNYSEVNVLRGSVKLALGSEKQSVVLIKNQRAVVEDNRVKSFNEIDKSSLTWRSNKLNFEGAPLSQVIDVLNDYFDVKILVEKNIKTCRITSKMSDMSLDEILEVLRLIANIESSVAKGQITLSGPSC